MRGIFIIRSFTFLLVSTLSLRGSDFGLHADLRDVQPGASISFLQAVGTASSESSSRVPRVRFTEGARVQLFVIAPMISRVSLRSSLSFARFRGELFDSRSDVPSLACDDISLESDLLISFHGGRITRGLYGILGGTVDHLHYYSEKQRGVQLYNNRLVDNGVNIGLGHSVARGEYHFATEVVFHKSIVHDREVSVHYPYMDNVRISYAIIF